jgi:hypothetical protein
MKGKSVIDVPAVLAIGVSAAGELGHASLKRGPGCRALISGPVVSRGAPLASRAEITPYAWVHPDEER